jgi:hypothetical protein
MALPIPLIYIQIGNTPAVNLAVQQQVFVPTSQFLTVGLQSSAGVKLVTWTMKAPGTILDGYTFSTRGPTFSFQVQLPVTPTTITLTTVVNDDQNDTSTFNNLINKTYVGAVSVKDTGAKGDVQTWQSATMAASGNTVSLNLALFTNADVGKFIVVNGSGAAGAPQRGTILSVQSPTQATVSFTATTPVSLAKVQWGTDDTTAIQTAVAIAAVQNQPVYFPAAATSSNLGQAVYACQPSTLQFTSRNMRFAGDPGNANDSFSFLGDGTVGRGVVILCIGAGSVISGPPNTGVSATSNMTGCEARDLALTWTDDAGNTPTAFLCRGIDYSGLVDFRFTNININVPPTCVSAGVYGKSVGVQGAEYGHFNNVSVFEGQIALPGTGSIGHYQAFGGGSNTGAISWVGGRITGIPIVAKLDESNGTSMLGITAEINTTATPFQFGVGGPCVGAHIQVKYFEASAACSLALFGSGTGNYSWPLHCFLEVEIMSASSPSYGNGATLPGVIDATSYFGGSNMVRIGNTFHGDVKVVPYGLQVATTSGTGSLQYAVQSGPPAIRCRSLSGVAATTGTAATDAANALIAIRELWRKMQTAGTMELYGPESEGTCLAFWTPYAVRARQPLASIQYWQDEFAAVAAAAAGTAPVYREDVSDYSGVISLGPPRAQPFVSFNKSGYFLGDLGGTFGASGCTLVVVWRPVQVSSLLEAATIFEVMTGATATGTGVQIQTTAAGNLVAKRCSDSVTASNALVVAGGNALDSLDWHVLAVTFEASEVTCYLDGVALANVGAAGSACSNSMRYVSIGANGDGTKPISGQATCFGVWNGVLSTQAMTRIYQYLRQWFGTQH